MPQSTTDGEQFHWLSIDTWIYKNCGRMLCMWTFLKRPTERVLSERDRGSCHRETDMRRRKRRKARTGKRHQCLMSVFCGGQASSHQHSKQHHQRPIFMGRVRHCEHRNAPLWKTFFFRDHHPLGLLLWQVFPVHMSINCEMRLPLYIYLN